MSTNYQNTQLEHLVELINRANDTNIKASQVQISAIEELVDDPSGRSTKAVLVPAAGSSLTGTCEVYFNRINQSEVVNHAIDQGADDICSVDDPGDVGQLLATIKASYGLNLLPSEVVLDQPLVFTSNRKGEFRPAVFSQGPDNIAFEGTWQVDVVRGVIPMSGTFKIPRETLLPSDSYTVFSAGGQAGYLASLVNSTTDYELSHEFLDFSAPTPHTGEPDEEVSVTVSSRTPKEDAYTGTIQIVYDKLTKADMVNYDGPVKKGWHSADGTTPTTIREWVNLNFVVLSEFYGLTPEDFVDGPLPVLTPADDTYPMTFTFEESCLLFKGDLDVDLGPILGPMMSTLVTTTALGALLPEDIDTSISPLQCMLNKINRVNGTALTVGDGFRVSGPQRSVVAESTAVLYCMDSKKARNVVNITWDRIELRDIRNHPHEPAYLEIEPTLDGSQSAAMIKAAAIEFFGIHAEGSDYGAMEMSYSIQGPSLPVPSGATNYYVDDVTWKTVFGVGSDGGLLYLPPSDAVNPWDGYQIVVHMLPLFTISFTGVPRPEHGAQVMYASIGQKTVPYQSAELSDQRITFGPGAVDEATPLYSSSTYKIAFQPGSLFANNQTLLGRLYSGSERINHYVLVRTGASTTQEARYYNQYVADDTTPESMELVYGLHQPAPDATSIEAGVEYVMRFYPFA